MLIPDKPNTGCAECIETCPKLQLGVGDKHWCFAHYCDVYEVPKFAEYYIAQLKKETKVSDQSMDRIWEKFAEIDKKIEKLWQIKKPQQGEY